MSTALQAATAAAMKIKDDSPDFDPRDQFTIERECSAMARAVLESLPGNLTLFTRSAVVDATLNGVTEAGADVVVRSLIDAVLLEG